MWAARNEKGEVSTPLLPMQAEVWETPAACDSEGGTIIPRPGTDPTKMQNYRLRDQGANWPTPNTAPEAPNNGLNRGNGQLRPREKTQCLNDAAIQASEGLSQWGTPTANDAENSLTNSQSRRNTLTADVAIWPTPQAFDGKDFHLNTADPVESSEQIAARKGGCYNLGEHATAWGPTHPGQRNSTDGPTSSTLGLTSNPLSPGRIPSNPTLRELCGCLLQEETEVSDGETLEASLNAYFRLFPSRRRLNWRFVEWLMGFPEGWLDCPVNQD